MGRRALHPSSHLTDPGVSSRERGGTFDISLARSQKLGTRDPCSFTFRVGCPLFAFLWPYAVAFKVHAHASSCPVSFLTSPHPLSSILSSSCEPTTTYKYRSVLTSEYLFMPGGTDWSVQCCRGPRTDEADDTAGKPT